MNAALPIIFLAGILFGVFIATGTLGERKRR